MDALRLQLAFPVAVHDLFPPPTVGLDPLPVVLETMALVREDPLERHAARFFGRLFALSFLFEVATGIPMELQFGTSWAGSSSGSSGVIGTALAMEGVFAFFLESAFLVLFPLGEDRIGPRLRRFSSLALFVGSWLSGFFVIATDAWMQHPVGDRVAADGTARLASFGALLSNSWALPWQHATSAALITGSLTMSAAGAFCVLSGRGPRPGRHYPLSWREVQAASCALADPGRGGGGSRAWGPPSPRA